MARALDYIGIARMGGGIETGEENTKSLIKCGKAELVILAADASDGAKRRCEGYVYGQSVPLIVVPYLKEDISAISGRPGCSMAAFLNRGLAASFATALEAEYGEAYHTAAEALEAKQKRAGTCAGRKTGNRRKNA